MTTNAPEPDERAIRHAAAMKMVRSSPTDHAPRLVSLGEIRAGVHGAGLAGRINNQLAVMVTRAVGTMWAAYLFVLIALVSLPQAFGALLAGDTVTAVSWLSQSFLQLVLLPIIIVGQNVISAAAEARAEADHETLTALHALNVRLLEQQQQLAALLERRSAG